MSTTHTMKSKPHTEVTGQWIRENSQSKNAARVALESVETAPRERLRRCYELAIEPDGQENQPQSENTKLRQENAELWETNRELLNAIEKVMDWWGRSATTGTEADDEMDPEVFDQAHAAIEKANALAKL